MNAWKKERKIVTNKFIKPSQQFTTFGLEQIDDNTISPIKVILNRADELQLSSEFNFPQIMLVPNSNSENFLPMLPNQQIAQGQDLDYNHKVLSSILVSIDHQLGYEHVQAFLLQRNPVINRLVVLPMERKTWITLNEKQKPQYQPVLGQKIYQLINGNEQFLLQETALKTVTGKYLADESETNANLFNNLIE